MQQINEHSIMEVLRSTEDYKNSKFIKTAIAEKNRASYDVVCQTIKKVIDSGPEISPNVKLLAFRLCKDIIDANNREFIEHFENIILQSFQRYVEFKAPTDELSRGATFFSPNPDKDLRQISVSIVRLALDIVLVLAMQYPDDLHQKNYPSKSFLFYMEMKMNKKVHFPVFAYFKQEKVDERKHPDYDKYEQQFHSGSLKLLDFQGQNKQSIQQAQIIQQSHSTPQGGTPGNVVQSHVNKINEHIDNIFSRISLTCGKTPLNSYDKTRFQDIENEVAAINGQLDDIMQNMGDDQQAESLYSKLEQMLQLEQDLDEYKNSKQFWPQFRQKYIGNAHDVEKELHDQAHREQERLLRLKEEEQLQLLISKQKLRDEEERQEQLRQEQLRQEELRQEQQRQEQQRQDQIRQDQIRQDQIRQEQIRQEQEHHRQEQIRQEKIRQEQIRQEEIRRQQEQEQLRNLEEQRLLNQQFQQQNDSQQNIIASKLHPSQQVQKPYEDQNPYMDKYHEIIDQQDQQKSQIQQSQIQGPTSKKPTSMTSKRGKSPISALVGHSGDAHQTIPEIYHPDHIVKQSQMQSQFQQSIQNQDIQKQQQPSEYDQQLIKDLKTQLDQKQIDNQVLKSQLEQKQFDLQQSQQQIADLKLDLQEHQIQKRMDQQMIAQLQNQLQSHNPQQAQSLIENQLHQQINTINKEYEVLQTRLDQERSHIKDLELKLRNKSLENDDLNQKLYKLSNEIKEIQNQHDQHFKSHQSQIQNQQIVQQQSFEQQLTLSRQENDQLKKQIQKLQDFVNKQQDNDLQSKHNAIQQEVLQLKRHLEDEKNEKDKLHQLHQDQIEQHKYTADESKRMIDMLKNQVNTLNMKNDKLQKDFELQSEKHKKSKEEVYQQVVDAKKESMSKQQQIDQMSFQLNDKEEDLKQLQISYKALEQENRQIKKNNDAQQQQITQFMEMINKQSSNKGNPIYQQKLQQALDEIDQLKEKHSKELLTLNQQNKELQQQLKDEREQFQVQLLQQQQYQQPIIIPIQNMQNEQLISNQPPEEMNFQTSNQKPQSVSNQNISDKLSIRSNKQQPLQKPCPLPQFKHFPPTSSFKWRQNVRQDKRAASDDYFDIIFPFQNPKEYYQNKQQKVRKGRITHSNQFMIDVAHLDQNNQKLFKQRALGTNGLLYLNKDLQIGVNQQIQNKQGVQFYTYGLYLTNTSRKSINIQFVVLEDEKFQTQWAQPQQVIKTLQDQDQILVELIAQHSEPIQYPIISQIQINQDHPFQILVPNNIVQMISYKDIKKVEFQQKWKSFATQIIRTDLLITNIDVFENVENLQSMIPQLIILNNHKLQDYEIGIDEIKLGGYAQILDTTFYIKFEFLPDDRLCIFVTYDSKYQKNRGLIEKILQSYSQLLGSGQSQDQ